jgi:hypothetical protein
MRAREMTLPSLKRTPRKENVSLPATAGTKKLPSERSVASKNSMAVVSATSTSEKTTPKPLVREAFAEPGMKNRTSVMLLPRLVNNLCALNGAKRSG